jgi:hypothetical protein
LRGKSKAQNLPEPGHWILKAPGVILLITQRDQAIQKRRTPTIDKMVFRVAGIFILVSLLLSIVHSPNWLWFTAFVGANMLQASFTGFCPLAKFLKVLGLEPGEAFK